MKNYRYYFIDYLFSQLRFYFYVLVGSKRLRFYVSFFSGELFCFWYNIYINKLILIINLGMFILEMDLTFWIFCQYWLGFVGIELWIFIYACVCLVIIIVRWGRRFRSMLGYIEVSYEFMLLRQLRFLGIRIFFFFRLVCIFCLQQLEMVCIGWVRLGD